MTDHLRVLGRAVLSAITFLAASHPAFPQANPPLKLVQTIELSDIRTTAPEVPSERLAQDVRTSRMPGLQNHFDHLTADLEHDRLFVVPEDNHSVEVYGLRSGKFIHSIKGFGVAHSVVYRADLNRIYVTDGSDGDLKIFAGSSYELLKTVKLRADADATGYDPATQDLYIANGGLDAKLNHGFLSIVNTDSGEKIGEIQIDSNRLEAMVVEKSGSRLFLNMTGKDSIGVIDRKKNAVIAVWPATGGHINAAVAIDEQHHRLFVACRDGRLVVMDSDSGKVLQVLPIASGVDDMVYDPASKRIYVACGEGFVDVYQEIDPDKYHSIGKIATGPLGKTGLLIPDLHRYFVAVPPHGNMPAVVLVYAVN